MGLWASEEQGPEVRTIMKAEIARDWTTTMIQLVAAHARTHTRTHAHTHAHMCTHMCTHTHRGGREGTNAVHARRSECESVNESTHVTDTHEDTRKQGYITKIEGYKATGIQGDLSGDH